MILLYFFVLFFKFTSAVHASDSLDKLYLNFLSSIEIDSTHEKPICAISRATSDPCVDAQNMVIGSLCTIGVYVICDEPSIKFFGKTINVSKYLDIGEGIAPFMENLTEAEHIFVLYTKKYKQRFEVSDSGVRYEVDQLKNRISNQKEKTAFLNCFLLEGKKEEAIPQCLADFLYADVTENERFSKTIFYLWFLDVLSQKIFKEEEYAEKREKN
jgi:hypothetical protein